MFGELSVPVIRFTSVAPYARGAYALLIASNNAFEAEGFPPCASPHAIMIAPARKFSCLSIPSSLIREQSNPTGTSGSVDCIMTCCLSWASAENAPKPSSVMTTLAAQKTEATRRRRVNGDCEVEFFFMWRLVWCRFLGQSPYESITFSHNLFTRLFGMNRCLKSWALARRSRD